MKPDSETLPAAPLLVTEQLAGRPESRVRGRRYGRVRVIGPVWADVEARVDLGKGKEDQS
jgi:hypothetical protein